MQSSSDSESITVVSRKLTAIDMFGEKMPAARQKYQEKPLMPTEIQNLNTQQASPKKTATMEKPISAVPENKG